MTSDSDLTAVAIANWNAAIDACAILVEVNQPLVADDMRKMKRQPATSPDWSGFDSSPEVAPRGSL